MATRAEGRDRSLRVQVSTEELEMVHALARAEGITASDYLRIFIRRGYAERFGAKKPRAAKKAG